MLKLLIIDDEIAILRGIAKIVKESKTPYTKIQSALDAKEALTMMDYFRPDLIITDIIMPGQNGLEFIKEVKDQRMCNRFLILSGYDEFEYAQQAIRMKVIDYLLKPIDKIEFINLLKRIAKETLEDKQSMGKQKARSDLTSYSFPIRSIIHYIRQNYHEDLYLDKFSDLTNLHPNYLSSLFKKEVGVTIIQYLQNFRIEKAKKLLIKYPSIPVHTIGNQVGYRNSQHFMKVFKKNVGYTPSDFREKQKTNL